MTILSDGMGRTRMDARMCMYMSDVAQFLASSIGFQELLSLAEVPHERRLGIDDWIWDEGGGAFDFGYRGPDVHISMCIRRQKVYVSASLRRDPSVDPTDMYLEWTAEAWTTTGIMSRLVTGLAMPTEMIKRDRDRDRDDMHVVSKKRRM